MRNPAAARVASFRPFTEDESRQQAEDEQELQQRKAKAFARLVRNQFSTSAGRRLLDLMIERYLLQQHNAQAAEMSAEYREGQASVIRELLVNFTLAEKGES